MQNRSRLLHSEVEVVPSDPRRTLLFDRRTGNCYALGAEDRCLLKLLEQGKTLDEVGDAFQSVVGRTIRKRHVREFLENLRQLKLLDDKADSLESHDTTNGSMADSAVRPRRHDPAPRLNFRFDLAGCSSHRALMQLVQAAELLHIEMPALARFDKQ